MFFSQDKNGYLLTGAILLFSLAGLLYFGYQSLQDAPSAPSNNPFEYSLKHFTQKTSLPAEYREIRRLELDFRTPRGIAVGTDGRIYVCGDESVLILSPDDMTRTPVPWRGSARCLAVDDRGKIYLGMDDHLEVIDAQGGQKRVWPSLGEKALITSLALSSGLVFVADAGHRIIWKYDRQGVVQGRIGAKNESKDIPGFVLPSPFFDVGWDPDGSIWVADTGRFSMENYLENGDFRSSWGESSMEWEGFCGCCNPSHFVLLSDGSVVTSEKGIPRVKVYNRLGKLVSVVAGPDRFQEGTVGLDLARDQKDRIYLLDPPNRAVRIFSTN